MNFFWRLVLAAMSVLLGAVTLPAAPTAPAALLVVLSDQHSAYERTAQVVALVDQLKAEHPGLPLAILLNGDTLEYGNPVARQSQGAVDFAMFAALAARAPTVLNLGNHEPEFYDLAESVKRIAATGVQVIGNIRDRVTGELFTPPSLQLRLGEFDAVVVGISTDHLATYRAAVRPSLDLADPVVWAKTNFPELLASTPIKIILSHAGIAADRQLLELVPDGTIFAGGHNHLRFIQPFGRTVYFHSGFWNEYVSLVWLGQKTAGPAQAMWVEQRRIATTDAGEPTLTRLIEEMETKYLTEEDRAVIGKTERALSPAAAARLAVAALREAAGVDAAFIGNTTFGAGLPAGEVQRVQFDASIRFEGTIYTAEVDGARLQQLLARANQDETTPFEERGGEYLVAVGPESTLDPAARYRIATSDWGARNTARYFGVPEIIWQESPHLRFKEIVRRALAK